MENFDRKSHWENVYQTKKIAEVSWYEPTAETSLSFIHELNIPYDAGIIDVGGGDSFLVDHLLHQGFRDITVLDISPTAIKRAQKRLGQQADQVKWIVADVAHFIPPQSYYFWHDRAAFHFLTRDEEISNYVETAGQYVKPDGAMVIGTFSEQGPKKCSGIDIRQYSEKSMTGLFQHDFDKIRCTTTNHTTPANTIQSFIFCSFKRKNQS